MTRKKTATLTRRSILSALGAGFTASAIATEAMAKQRTESRYVLVQGDSCVPVQPIRGRVPADEFYGYQLPEKYVTDANGATVGDTATYASAGTRDLQRAQTSIAFLYLGPEGLSLVVVHGSTQASDGGSVTFRISGLPEDGEWIVKDDLYRNPDTGELASTNYDRWNVDDTEHRIDWTWGSSGTDGGVFRDLGDTFELVVRPSFNEAAPLYNQEYEGTVTDWQFLSGSADDVSRVSLDLDEPILVTTGRCKSDTTPAKPDKSTPQQDTKQETATEQGTKTKQERTEEREKDKEESEKERAAEEDKKETEAETQTEKETKTEAKGETKTERKKETEKKTEESKDTKTETKEETKTEAKKERETEESKDTKTETEKETRAETEKKTEKETEEEASGKTDDETEAEKEAKGKEKEQETEAEEQEKEREKEGNEGRGNGHDKGRGKGHDKSRGNGHDKGRR